MSRFQTSPLPILPPRSLAARSAWSRRVGDDPGYTLQGALTQLKALPSKCLAAQMEIRMIEVCMGQGMRTK